VILWAVEVPNAAPLWNDVIRRWWWCSHELHVLL